MQEFRGAGCLRIRTAIRLSHAIDAGPNRFGQRIIAYDLNSNTPGGRFYPPQDPTSTELTAGIYIDRTSIGVFVDGGLYSYSTPTPMEPRPDKNNDGELRFRGNRLEIKELEVFSVQPIRQPE